MMVVEYLKYSIFKFKKYKILRVPMTFEIKDVYIKSYVMF